MAKGPGIWTAAIATKRINACARGDNLRLIYKVHAREQMFARDLLIQDVLHVLRFGFVYDEGEKSTQPDYFKYRIEGKSPNSGGRMVRLVVVPDGMCSMKIITVMWKDEK